jgi:hypothetical protein
MAPIVDIEEESRKYEDEWVLFEVTEVDERSVPVKGRLLHHCKGRREGREEVNREEMKYRDLDTYVFFTGEPVPPNIYVALWALH